MARLGYPRYSLASSFAVGCSLPICHERQFIFFHIPRCGGTSIEEAFALQKHDSLFGTAIVRDQTIAVHHMTAQNLLDADLLDRRTFDAYFKFTVVRDPFDRMASDYRWQRRHDYHGEFARLTFQQYLDRAETVVQEETYLERRHYDHFRPMLDYCLYDGELMVDDILRLENIDLDIERLRPRLGDGQLHCTNASPDYSALRTPENLGRVYEIYAADKLLCDNIETLLQ